MTASLYQRVSCFSHSSINDRSRQAVPGAQMFQSAEFSPAYYRYLCNGLPGGAARRSSSGQGQLECQKRGGRASDATDLMPIAHRQRMPSRIAPSEADRGVARGMVRPYPEIRATSRLKIRSAAPISVWT